MVDILVYDGWVRSGREWLNPGYLTIQDGRIKTISAGQPGQACLENAHRKIRANGRAVLPGLTNGHTHFSQTFMRGLSAGRPLLRWLKELIWPLQAAMSVEDIRLAALLGLVENLRCGVTEVVDHQKITASREHTRVVAEAVRQIGLNCLIARSWSDRGVYAEVPQSILDELQAWYALERDFQGEQASLRFASGPLATWRCTAETLQKTHELAVQNGSITHIHAAETQDELQISLDENGKSPIRWLDSIGLLGPDTQVVHAVWIDEEEIEILAGRGATVVHCPVSNAVLGAGVAPAARMAERKIHLRLGTDGPASNDTQDLFETIKIALSLARAHFLDSSALQPEYLLTAATDGRLLEPGAAADVILVNLEHERAVPVNDVDSALVLCTHGSDVETVIVGGKILMQDRKLLVIDEEALYKECNTALVSLRKRAGLE